MIVNAGKIYQSIEDGYISIVILISVIILVFFGLVFFGLILYHVCFKFLLISFQIDKRTIIFNYPFLLRKTKYSFEEINGFRFSTVYNGKGWDYKALIFKTKDNKKYSITDLEIKNTREIESFALENFQLKKGEEFETLNYEERNVELEKNKQFDISQAKEYRISCYMLLALVCAIIWLGNFNAQSDRKIGWIGYSLAFLAVFVSIYNIIRAHKRIKELSG